MKKAFTLLFLVSFISRAQTTKITYTAEIDVERAGMGEEHRIDKATAINATLRDITFVLLYSGLTSKFYTYEVLNRERQSVDDALASVFMERPVYNYKVFRYEHGAKDLAKEDYLVKSNIKDSWELHKDTLTIIGYKCFKATRKYFNGLILSLKI